VAREQLVLDDSGSSPLDLNDITNYIMEGGWDWGDEAIARIVFDGDLDQSQYDNVLQAGRITREIQGAIRISAASPAALLDLEQAVNAKLNRASRANPIKLRFRPNNSSTDSFWNVIGGSIKSVYDKRQSVVRIKYLECSFTTEPFTFGAAQNLGTVQANTLTPFAVDVTPTAGLEGDVPADVKISVTANTTGSLHLAALMCAAWSEGTGAGLPGWYESSSLTLDTIGSTVVDAATHGGSVVKGTGTATNTPQPVAYTTISRPSGGWPVGLPARIFVVCRDKQTTTGNRGKTTIRGAVSLAGSVSYGDWTPITPGALSGSTPLMTLVDLGVFPMPPGVTSDPTALPTFRIWQQSTIASAGVDYDFVIVVPDSTLLYAEDPVSDYTPAKTIDVTNDQVFDPTLNGQAFPIVRGSHVRFKGPGRIFVAGFSEPAATDGTHDVLSMNCAAAVTYTPRYIGLA